MVAAAAIAEAAVDARRPQSFGSPLIAAVHSVAQTIRGEQVGRVALHVGGGGVRDTGCEASLKANEVRDRVPPLRSSPPPWSSMALSKAPPTRGGCLGQLEIWKLFSLINWHPLPGIRLRCGIQISGWPWESPLCSLALSRRNISLLLWNCCMEDARDLIGMPPLAFPEL